MGPAKERGPGFWCYWMRRRASAMAGETAGGGETGVVEVEVRGACLGVRSELLGERLAVGGAWGKGQDIRAHSLAGPAEFAQSGQTGGVRSRVAPAVAHQHLRSGLAGREGGE